MSGRIAEAARKFGREMLERDNYIIGVLICVFAAYDWISFYDGFEDISIYFSQGIYTLSTLSILNSFFSALYLTLAAIILLTLRPPVARYRTALPNLLAILAAFIVYAFVLVPAGSLTRVSVYAGLFLVASGSLIVICSLVHLRQAFSVTPQARFLIDSGLYGLVRHPMYVGNIVSILGVALLVDSVPGYLLFVVCAALQICRALVEERLLTRNLPGYAAYADRVGRFLPRLAARNRAQLAVTMLATVLLVALPPGAGVAGGALAPAPARSLDEPAVPGNVQHAKASSEAVGKCAALKEKAFQDEWFSNADVKTINKIEFMESGNEVCDSFVSLINDCRSMQDDWEFEKKLKDGPFLDKVEGRKGCRSIVGFDSVCTALRNIARKGVTLSDERKDLIAECLQTDLRRRRPSLIRPAM